MNGEYTGGTFGWLSAFSVLCGIGLCLGYALLGACWLVRKRSGEVRDVARGQIPVLAIGVLLFLIARVQPRPVAGSADPASMDRPALSVRLSRDRRVRLPACWRPASCRHDDYWPFHMVSLIFASAFGTLALSFWPYMVPFRSPSMSRRAAFEPGLHVLGRGSSSSR